ncbi:MAG TPA: phosphotransferase family protein [Ilumatobacteraceae bacterium]|nr:phosphotransferase family protein [Ilumatobacteraceae bacterium]
MSGPTTSGASMEIPGLDVGRASAWLDANVDGASGPFEFDLIAGGHSNLTFAVTAADGTRFVLRRPPLGHVLASAHDMGREHRILAGLQDTAVPVPRVEGFCADPDVIGAPFYVMRFVVGHVIRDAETARKALTPDARATASRSLVDTMAKIHAVDLVAAGLDDLGRHEGYIARQLRRWYGNISEQRTRDLPAIDRIHDALAARIPDQVGASLVHGDYRLDNCMVDDSGELVAVLDWEICTLGDPLADVGLLTVYWTGPDDPPGAWTAGATTEPGFWPRARIAERYAEVSGRDVSNLDFYVAFAYWKLACILEGVYARYLGGALGDRDPAELAHFKEQVDAAAANAEQTLEQLA